ncbi:MAG: hypothetical protein JWQ09_6048 [Segetibacter sp.]|nr:hypothetical protein [Bacteroidota bacterium]MCW3111542.1 hypothetical protein [Segetibacter sp.]
MNPQNINNKNPFGTGADYFESFQAKLSGRIEEYEELKTEAPFLSNIPKYNPFEVPAHYFDELPTLIREKCAAPERTSAFEWLKMLFRPNFAVPVLTVIVIAFAGIRSLEQKTESSSPMAEEINVEEQLQDIDETTIIEALASASVNESEAGDENENIKEYLLDNHIEDINTEL